MKILLKITKENFCKVNKVKKLENLSKVLKVNVVKKKLFLNKQPKIQLSIGFHNQNRNTKVSMLWITMNSTDYLLQNFKIIVNLMIINLPTL